VHRPLGEQGEDRGAHVAPAGPRAAATAPVPPPAPAAELGAAAESGVAADPGISVVVSMVHLKNLSIAN
jgi:hypothetical protein